MEKSIISEGKTTNEAIEKGLKILNVSKNKVDIKVLENEEKRSFFSILTPRVVKVQLNVLSAIAGKKIENKVRVFLDIESYRAKREKTLEELAEKISKTVIKTKKSITLEPMQAYERKIIHSKLQNNELVTTKSIGEEPRRRVVISLKNK